MLSNCRIDLNFKTASQVETRQVNTRLTPAQIEFAEKLLGIDGEYAITDDRIKGSSLLIEDILTNLSEEFSENESLKTLRCLSSYVDCNDDEEHVDELLGKLREQITGESQQVPTELSPVQIEFCESLLGTESTGDDAELYPVDNPTGDCDTISSMLWNLSKLYPDNKKLELLSVISSQCNEFSSGAAWLDKCMTELRAEITGEYTDEPTGDAIPDQARAIMDELYKQPMTEYSTSPTGYENHLSPLRFQTFNRKVF